MFKEFTHHPEIIPIVSRHHFLSFKFNGFSGCIKYIDGLTAEFHFSTFIYSGDVMTKWYSEKNIELLLLPHTYYFYITYSNKQLCLVQRLAKTWQTANHEDMQKLQTHGLISRWFQESIFSLQRVGYSQAGEFLI
jgi:hypothetical protein